MYLRIGAAHRLHTLNDLRIFRDPTGRQLLRLLLSGPIVYVGLHRDYDKVRGGTLPTARSTADPELFIGKKRGDRWFPRVQLTC
jgi:hypothetical protein